MVSAGGHIAVNHLTALFVAIVVIFGSLLGFSFKIFQSEGFVLEETSAEGVEACWAQIWHIVVAGQLMVEQKFWVLRVRVESIGFDFNWQHRLCIKNKAAETWIGVRVSTHCTRPEVKSDRLVVHKTLDNVMLLSVDMSKETESDDVLEAVH